MKKETEERIRLAAGALLSMQRHSWEQGTAMQAFYECGQMETVVQMAHEAVYRCEPDGRTAVIDHDHAITDPCSVGEALLAAIRLTQDPLLIAGEKALRNWAMNLAPKNAEGIRYHILGGTEFWVDSMYMLPPYLAAAGECEEAWKLYLGYWEALYDEAAGLMVHMWDDAKKVWSDPSHWGIGNGWCLMAIARLIRLFRADAAFTKAHPEAEARLAGDAEKLIRKILTCRDAEGNFHDMLDKPETFTEHGIASMTAYTLYSGMNDGWLSQDWKEEADALRLYVEKMQDAYGFVREICGAPSFDKSGIAPEQQAAFMMMEYQYGLGPEA